MSDDFAFEPIRGIPAALPPGEHLLWQGGPRWQAVAQHVFHVRAIAIYFALLCIWRIAATLHDGGAVGAALVGCLPLVGLAIVALGLLTPIAWLIGRSTVYSITSKRIFIRFGVALPITLNIPFKVLGSASLKRFPDGIGSIPLSLVGKDRIAYLVLWPHVRPWKFRRAEPTLRFVPDAEVAAGILGRAVAAVQAGTTVSVPQSAVPAKVVPANGWPGAPAAA